MLITAGCSTKNYVRTQTTPLVQKTNELDDAVAANNRSIQSTNDRAQAGIQQAQQSANTATQNASCRNPGCDPGAGKAQEAVNRADSLASVVANLDNYKQIGDVSVTFGFDKSVLTKDDQAQLDALGPQLARPRATSSKSPAVQTRSATRTTTIS